MREYAGARSFGTFGVQMRVEDQVGVAFLPSFLSPPIVFTPIRKLMIYFILSLQLHLRRLPALPTLLRPARRPPRSSHLTRRAGRHRVADYVPEHLDRDEPPYESAVRLRSFLGECSFVFLSGFRVLRRAISVALYTRI
jgi:hypothetical protein